MSDLAELGRDQREYEWMEVPIRKGKILDYDYNQRDVKNGIINELFQRSLRLHLLELLGKYQ